MTTYSYDDAGNQTSFIEANGDRTTNTWDDENRRLTFAEPGGFVQTATYNADGRRVKKKAPTPAASGGEYHYLWDGADLLNEYIDSSGTKLAKFVYTVKPEGEHGRLVSAYGPSVGASPKFLFEYLYDALGSTTHLLGTQEVMGTPMTFTTVATRCDAFGDFILGPFGGLGGLPHRYYVAEWGYYPDLRFSGSGAGLTAHLVDNYVRARTYDSATARWLSRDPIGLLAGDANLYRYVMNNPVLHIDPSGLCTVCQVSLVQEGNPKGEHDQAFRLREGQIGPHESGARTILDALRRKIGQYNRNQENDAGRFDPARLRDANNQVLPTPGGGNQLTRYGSFYWTDGAGRWVHTHMFAIVVDYCEDTGPCFFKFRENGVISNRNAQDEWARNDQETRRGFGAEGEGQTRFDNLQPRQSSTMPNQFPPGVRPYFNFVWDFLKEPTVAVNGAECSRRVVLTDSPTGLGNAVETRAVELVQTLTVKDRQNNVIKEATHRVGWHRASATDHGGRTNEFTVR